MLSVIMLSVIMLSVIMLHDVILSVVAPAKVAYPQKSDHFLFLSQQEEKKIFKNFFCGYNLKPCLHTRSTNRSAMRFLHIVPFFKPQKLSTQALCNR